MSKELIARLRDKTYYDAHAIMDDAAYALEAAEAKLEIATKELERCKRIMLHECGIGLVDENVLAQLGDTNANT